MRSWLFALIGVWAFTSGAAAQEAPVFDRADAENFPGNPRLAIHRRIERSDLAIGGLEIVLAIEDHQRG